MLFLFLGNSRCTLYKVQSCFLSKSISLNLLTDGFSLKIKIKMKKFKLCNFFSYFPTQRAVNLLILKFHTSYTDNWPQKQLHNLLFASVIYITLFSNGYVDAIKRIDFLHPQATMLTHLFKVRASVHILRLSFVIIMMI